MRSPLPPHHLRTLLLAALMGCNLLPISAHAGLQEGAMAYVAGDQVTALREFEPLALQGVQEAINGIKYLLDDGYAQAGYAWGKLIESRIIYGTLEDALSWYSKAADNGHAEAGVAQKRLAPTIAAIEKKRADEYAAAERKRAEEYAAAERKRAEEVKREQQRLAQWRKKLQIGDDTHCGPIIEVRRPMFKLALNAQIKGFSSESWLKESELFTPDYGCRNVNGRLSSQ